MNAPAASTCPAQPGQVCPGTVIVPLTANTRANVWVLPMSADRFSHRGGLPTAVKVACPCQLPAQHPGHGVTVVGGGAGVSVVVVGVGGTTAGTRVVGLASV